MSLNARFCTLDESHTILAAVLDRSDDAIVRLGLDGSIVGWSPGATRMYGYLAHEVIGSPLTMLIDEGLDDLARLLEDIHAGVSLSRREIVGRAKNGCRLFVRMSLVPLVSDRTRAIGAVAVMRDLTALKQAEAERRAGDARWRAIIDSAADGVIVIDGHGIIESFNSAAERLFGYRRQEVVGKNVSILMPPPDSDRHDRYIATYLAGGPPKIIGKGRQVTARRKNGETFPARLAVSEASVDGQTRFTGIVHDLTDRLQMETRLREQAALAKIGEMSAIVAHEVRNALAGVRGTVQVIGARLPAGSPEAAAAGEVVNRLDGLTAIVKDILMFANLPSPKAELINIVQLVASTATFARADPLFRDIEIEPTGDAPLLVADPNLLRTVLLNLLMNSAQAMEGVGTIRVCLGVTEGTCRIAVSDQGPGVPVDVRERLFTPFFTTKARGSGLGLATAKRIVEAHGGELRMEFPAEGGTRVVIQLPVRMMAAAGSE
jgi:two-component system sensor kinase FixL